MHAKIYEDDVHSKTHIKLNRLTERITEKWTCSSYIIITAILIVFNVISTSKIVAFPVGHHRPHDKLLQARCELQPDIVHHSRHKVSQHNTGNQKLNKKISTW